MDAMVQSLLHDLEMVVEGQGQIAGLTGTIGLAWSREARHVRDVLLHHADAALYTAKRAQKGTAQSYAAEADGPTTRARGVSAVGMAPGQGL
nr:diguanylate cyclase [Methylobacterium sp. GC_Met_2]